MTKIREYLLDAVELIRLARDGDENARNEAIVSNLALVWSIVRRFSGRGHDNDDLFQIGSIGLMKAVDRFDDSYDVRFSTYAVPMIIGEIKRYLRDDGMVKVSRNIRENGLKINNAVKELSQRYNREPTIEEISDHTGLAIDDIVTADSACRDVGSIYSESYRESERNTGECDEKDILLDRILISELISQLDENERKLIILRFFQEKTQSEVAAALGTNQVRVSRLEKKILGKMRKKALE